MIRKKADQDIDSIVDIWLRASVLAHDFVSPEFWQEHTESMRSTYIPNSETWVCERDGRIIGFFSLADDKLAALFVEPESQGNGAGQKLLNKAKSLRDTLELSVYTANTKAITFYVKTGFKAVANKVDRHTGHDETVMTWKA